MGVTKGQGQAVEKGLGKIGVGKGRKSKFGMDKIEQNRKERCDGHGRGMQRQSGCAKGHVVCEFGFRKYMYDMQSYMEDLHMYVS